MISWKRHLAAGLAHNARRRPGHPALLSGAEVISYAQLDRRVSQIAHGLRDKGLKPGDLVGLSLPDSPDYLAALLGILRARCVAVPLDWRWTNAEKTHLATGFDIAQLLTTAEADPLDGVSMLALDARWNSYPEEDIFSGEAAPGDPAILSLSSGTTGTPKGPLLTHAQLVARFMSQWVSLGFNETDRFCCATPLYFGGGRNFTLAHLYTGSTVHLFCPPYQPEELIDAVRETEITTVFLVPTLLRRVLESWEGEGLAWPGLRQLISSGAALHAEERAQIAHRLTPNIINLYSSTEGGSVAVLRADAQGKAASSVGQAFFMNEFQIVDGSAEPVATGEIGRIRQRAPWIPDGFYRNEAASAEAFQDGWYYPGDLGRVDDEGFLYIAGRAKDMIIRGGVNIYPQEIEAVLLEHGAVAEAAVVAWPAQAMGEEVAAFIAPAAHQNPDPEQLESHCRDHLASYKVPKGFFFQAELPKNSSGKVLKKDLQALLPTFDSV